MVASQMLIFHSRCNVKKVKTMSRKTLVSY